MDASEKVGKDIATEILKRHDLRVTPVRLMVLRLIARASRPISAQEIENELETVDRSSITRTLASFSELHIIHQISDGSASKRYELCNDPESPAHNDEHAHFHCRMCGKTFCLPNVHLTSPELPEGYQSESVAFVITGLCPDCQ